MRRASIFALLSRRWDLPRLLNAEWRSGYESGCLAGSFTEREEILRALWMISPDACRSLTSHFQGPARV